MSAANDPDGPTPVIVEEYDPEVTEPMSVRIIRLVSIASDRSVTDLKPLGSVIDLEAIDDLLNSRLVEDPDVSVDISFPYEGYLVDIEANGTISILVEEE